MITLTYSGMTLELRNPDFGNKEALEQRRIYRKIRGGDLKVYRDDTWPKTLSLSYKFSYLKEEQVYSIIAFLRATLGQTVSLTDYEGRTWSVVITTPADEIIQAARENTTFSIEFQEVVS